MFLSAIHVVSYALHSVSRFVPFYLSFLGFSVSRILGLFVLSIFNETVFRFLLVFK